MDFLPHFHREIAAFEAAALRADGAPLVPSCPGWTVPDLVVHLGFVHHYVSHIIRNRLAAPPDTTDLAFLELPADTQGWPRPENAPNHSPMPASLLDWFAAGAARLASLFAEVDPAERVWTWSREQSVGFWLRMQTIEAALHRW